jgi:exopolysaccharide biosynthesis polyprenyl glycosylphosphotransferase
MNKKIQALKYLFADAFSAGFAWFLFFAYRKSIIEAQVFDVNHTIMQDERFRYGLVSVALFWVFVYALSGYYESIYRRSRLLELKQTIVQTFFGVLVIFFVALLDDTITSYKNYYGSILILFSFHFSLTFILRYTITTRTIRKIHNREIGFKTLIVGGGESAVMMYKSLKESPKSSGNIFVGFVNGMDLDGHLLEAYTPYLGSYKNLADIIQSNEIEEVLIAIERSEQNHILEEIINDLEALDVLIKVKPNNYDILAGKVKMKSIFEVPLVEIKHELMPLWQIATKRIFDVLIALTAVLILSPLCLFVVLFIKLDSKGPIFFFQERVGINGKLFNIIKFRSMCVDAEKEGPQLSGDDDARVTRWGRFMRRYRIDELPQFLNVLMGDMSMVGPRPERAHYADQIMERAPYYKHVRKVRPGITSWGMVRHGYASSVDEMIDRLRYDIIYIENLSLFNDLKVLIYTFKIVFQGRGK